MMIVEIYGRQIIIDKPTREARERWNGHLSPEPETVAWIESLPAQSVFFDIGANVGTFSTRAALRSLQVHAFEPEINHFLQLCDLVMKNQLLIALYPMAVYYKSVAGRLLSGRSNWTFVPSESDSLSPRVMAVSLDDFTSQNKIVPNHIKIDVDGNEYDVLRGALVTLGLTAVKSLLIEIDPGVPAHSAIVPLMKHYGFTYSKEQVEASRVRGGKYDGLANWIFRRGF